VSRLKHVVLPAPFGPIKAWIEPLVTLKDTPSTAVNPLNSLVSPLVTRMASSSADMDALVWCEADARAGSVPGRSQSLT